MRASLIALLGSKKFITALLGALTVACILLLDVGGASASALASDVVTLVAVLLGSQGIADYGKGSASVQPITLRQALAGVWRGLMASKKFQTAVLGAIALTLIKCTHMSTQAARIASDASVTLCGVLLGAQGLTDFGKARQVPAPANIERKNT